jgi:hypothetical protein
VDRGGRGLRSASHAEPGADAGKLVERWRAEDVDYDFKTWHWTGENLV